MEASGRLETEVIIKFWFFLNWEVLWSCVEDSVAASASEMAGARGHTTPLLSISALRRPPLRGQRGARWAEFAQAARLTTRFSVRATVRGRGRIAASRALLCLLRS